VRRSTMLPFALLSLCLLGGCGLLAPPPQPRGDRINRDELSRLVPGKTTQADAAALLGSPTAKGTFDQNTWIYISEMTRPVIGGTNAVLAQHVVQLRFNDRGVLEKVDDLTKANALPAPMVARTTPSPGTEATFLQQLFGNVGRYNPGFGGAAGGPSVGAPVAR
jgi:outer membrane protein assembly factor BamE (lipoprotein component of BamABCDE complex)